MQKFNDKKRDEYTDHDDLSSQYGCDDGWGQLQRLKYALWLTLISFLIKAISEREEGKAYVKKGVRYKECGEQMVCCACLAVWVAVGTAIYFLARHYLEKLLLPALEQRHVFVTGCDSGFGRLLAL